MLLLLLACTGAPKPGDTAGSDDSSPAGPTSSDECDTYVACAAAVDADAATVEATYAEGGTCWSDPSTADGCTAACEAGTDALLDANPEEPACGGAPMCPGDDGPWTMQVDSTCSGKTDTELSGTMVCIDGTEDTFTWDLPFFSGFVLQCSATGLDFTCEGNLDGSSTLLTGTFNEYGTRAEGTWSIRDEECGPFSASR
jgi:hypothetical protein